MMYVCSPCVLTELYIQTLQGIYRRSMEVFLAVAPVRRASPSQLKRTDLGAWAAKVMPSSAGQSQLLLVGKAIATEHSYPP